mmetsp:Transcript_28031/g.39606  ORF Transcript_28031/g.39606 Transcript_28031/m.39606 type:complete len:208 (+) Transcript_28031:64-687(+)
MMSFCLLLLEWRNFTKEQIVFLQLTSGISGMIGGALGGFLGDHFGSKGPLGRIAVAFTSKVIGTTFFCGYVFFDNYMLVLVCCNLFKLTATWTPAAAIRPLCADLARNPSERAQIVALWMLLEKTSASVFGAPLVGYLTKTMLDKHKNDENEMDPATKAAALSTNLFGLSVLFWGMCCFFWIVMARTLNMKDFAGAEQIVKYQPVKH